MTGTRAVPKLRDSVIHVPVFRMVVRRELCCMAGRTIRRISGVGVWHRLCIGRVALDARKREAMRSWIVWRNMGIRRCGNPSCGTVAIGAIYRGREVGC